jgi:hydroxymethylpyrimidine/phosphomethylpyrimidine kinase
MTNAKSSRGCPIALTIAGSDSGGGAGIQADLKTFHSLGVHGTCAITCITAQNPVSVTAIQPCKPAIVRSQIEAVFAELPPAAVKTGMLFSGEIIRTIVELFNRPNCPPLVVDPVMIATSRASLLKSSAVAELFKLLPLAVVITPNLDETGVLTGSDPPRSVEEMRAAARQIHARFGCAALVKGGHLRGVKEAIDIFYDGRDELLLSAPFIRGVATHGTGCTYSAAIAAWLASGKQLGASVRLAKDYITRAVANTAFPARHAVLGWLRKAQINAAGSSASS